MAEDQKRPDDQPFLKRWSQRKIEARETQAAPPPVTAEEASVPQLPPLETLTPQSDFSAFMHPKVDPDMRRAALKKLFADPHFNVMDGLDIYIDDYSSNPLPPVMLAGLRQAQNILAWAKETPEETAARFNAPAAAPPDVQVADAAPSENAAQPAQEAQPAAPPSGDGFDSASKA